MRADHQRAAVDGDAGHGRIAGLRRKGEGGHAVAVEGADGKTLRRIARLQAEAAGHARQRDAAGRHTRRANPHIVDIEAAALRQHAGLSAWLEWRGRAGQAFAVQVDRQRVAGQFQPQRVEAVAGLGFAPDLLQADQLPVLHGDQFDHHPLAARRETGAGADPVAFVDITRHQIGAAARRSRGGGRPQARLDKVWTLRQRRRFSRPPPAAARRRRPAAGGWTCRLDAHQRGRAAAGQPVRRAVFQVVAPARSARAAAGAGGAACTDSANAAHKQAANRFFFMLCVFPAAPAILGWPAYLSDAATGGIRRTSSLRHHAGEQLGAFLAHVGAVERALGRALRFVRRAASRDALHHPGRRHRQRVRFLLAHLLDRVGTEGVQVEQRHLLFACATLRVASDHGARSSLR